ncbi:hypothetical protein Pan44_33970 [Caulifigura coniformis]|uniref:Uncharacterized protein n=1 Tax=Caulifigura coniformis TaxID=2527983 RepID=A0A517SGV4_9PLAN|nr:hypothetical protein Pan44_33970 [Caulifigura coniformis]
MSEDIARPGENTRCISRDFKPEAVAIPAFPDLRRIAMTTP